MILRPLTRCGTGAFLAVLTALTAAPARADFRVEAGDFFGEVEQLRGLVFAANSGRYVPPTQAQANSFSQAALDLWAGDIPAAVTRADALGYHVVEFTDTNTGHVFYGLREDLVGGQPTRGWGSFFVNFNYAADRLVEVPHPLADANTEEIGAAVFLVAGARGFLMAGAHRNANGPETADVAHLSRSVFQSVHQAWNGPDGATAAWQLHGFVLGGFPTFPAGTRAVLSNGAGDVTFALAMLDWFLEEAGLRTYVYNTLPADDPLNVFVNDGVLGTRFSGLGATTNVQGLHSRALGGDFVHVEMEQFIRFNATRRWNAAVAIAYAMLYTP